MTFINYKKWLVAAIFMSLIIPACVAGINYYMDPLWCFSISHRYNQKQDDFNERQQKTNYITFHDFDYDGLIMGTSSTAGINQHNFKELRVYNYSINALSVPEYLSYIQYARENNGRDFRVIFLGLDFLLTAAGLPSPPFDSSKIFDETRSPLFRVKSLISLSTLQFSRRNFMNYLYGRHIYYDRDNVKHTTKLDMKDTQFNMMRLIEHFEKSDKAYSFNNYKYNPGYRATLQEIRDKAPAKNFVIFTSPVAKPFMTSMVRAGLLDEYERWIRDIVDVFGECHNFMIPSRLTGDYMNNFHDPNNCYPFVADTMIDAMYNSKDPEASGICIHITRANIDVKLTYIRRLFREAAARN